MSAINEYHAHVYYDAPRARRPLKLCRRRARRSASRSDACTTIRSARIRAEAASSRSRSSSSPRCSPGSILNRAGLTVFAHAQTGNALKDHTDHVIWLGPSETLKLSALS